MYKKSSKKYVSSEKLHSKREHLSQQLDIAAGVVYLSHLKVGNIVVGTVIESCCDYYLVKVFDGHGMIPLKEIPEETKLQVSQVVRARVIGFLPDSSMGMIVKLRMRKVEQ